MPVEFTLDRGARLLRSRGWGAVQEGVFVAPDVEMYGVLRMYQMMTESDADHSCIVATETEALAWLATRGHREAASDETPSEPGA